MRCGIKKCVLALSLVCAASFLFAQEEGGSSRSSGVVESELYYYNRPIVKIFDHPRGYYILYRTLSHEVKSMCVPSEWFGYDDHRAFYDFARPGVEPYISYVTSNGEFRQIRIIASRDVRDLTWGRVSSNTIPDEYFDTESVTLQF